MLRYTLCVDVKRHTNEPGIKWRRVADSLVDDGVQEQGRHYANDVPKKKAGFLDSAFHTILST